MKKAVMYGAGNIGRGFVGALFAQSGYAVTFIDVADAVVDALHTLHRYPVRLVSDRGHEDLEISGVDAIHGNAAEAVATAIAEADLMATAVGVRVLPHIAPRLAEGLRMRFAITDRPLNILLCENLLDVDRLLAGMIREHLTPSESVLFDERIGLVEASIGRMVPVQTPDMQAGDPLRICVERYGFLPVDKAAFKGAIPDLRGMIPFAPFDYYIRRKLYLHNMGHAVCAYLGGYAGISLISAAIDDADIRILVQNAMEESAQALSVEYGVPLGDLLPHVEDLLFRFTNTALGDTCARVGGDPKRKLGTEDRLIGAARLCLVRGIPPMHICVGIAGALLRYMEENTLPKTEAQAIVLLGEVSGLPASCPQSELAPLTGAEPLSGSELPPDSKPLSGSASIHELVLDMFRPMASGTSLAEIRRLAQKRKAELVPEIV